MPDQTGNAEVVTALTGVRRSGAAKRPGRARCLRAAAMLLACLTFPGAGWCATVMNSPLFEGKDLAGGSHSLAALMKDGKTTIVFFWALRCAPCLREMAALDEIYRARRAEGLEILAIEAAGNSPQLIEEILDKLKDITIAPSYPILPDPDAALNRKFAVQVAPRTFLINRLGEIVFSFESFSGELRDKLNAGIDALLAGREFSPDAPIPPKAVPVAPATPSHPEPSPRTPLEDAAKAAEEEEFEKNRYFADFYLHKEEFDKAIAAYQKCIKLRPDNLHVRLKIGEAYAMKKMYAEAREAWEYVIRINPGNTEADANLRRLLRGEY